MRLMVRSIDASCSSFCCSHRLFFGLFLCRQAGDSVANEPALMHEISRDDRVARGMSIEPALAVAKQLFDLVGSNPVVLLVVEHRNEHIQVRQQVAQSARRAERDGKQPARAERRHALVELMACRFDLIAERFEQRRGGMSRRHGREGQRDVLRAAGQSP